MSSGPPASIILPRARPDFQDFQAVDSAQMNSPYAQRNSSSAWGLFAQDRWRATSKLTINYGLRWDIFETPHESYDRMAFFDPTIPNPAAGGHLGAITFFGPGAGRNGRHNILD